jgi:tripartite ATP-independent transporter DctM subunit
VTIDRPIGAIERWILVAAFFLATLLPLVEAIGRPLGGIHIPGSAIYVQQVTLWLAFVGGVIATRDGKHLTISTAALFGEGSRMRAFARLFANATAASVVAALAWASVELVRADREIGDLLPNGLPQWVSECVMPVALALMALRFVATASDGWKGRAVSLAAIAATFGLGLVPQYVPALAWPVAIVIVVAGLWGAPVFVVMGGLAMLLFLRQGSPIGAVSAEIYRLVASPTLPAIPLLTAAGYILAEAKSSARLVKLFQSLFGSLPGGIAVMVAAVCALFTTFTGGSGVTIIALGGLVYPMLIKAKYPEGFSLGLVTASGSLGLLLPPSLPVILYSVVAQLPADNLYIAGLLPGVLMIGLVAAYGIRVGLTIEEERVPFSIREALGAIWGAKWELSLPLIVIALFASGVATLVEAAAAACAWAAIIACVITRDIRLRELPGVIVKAGALVGAVMILLSVAMGLTSYLVDAQIPDALLAWVQAHIHSKIVFLLVLNVILLVLGSVLEIYSAIIILVPLVVPMAAPFGIDPIHLGIVFLANLELGFLFPPVGLNLFLASARFGTPLTKLYRHVAPFLAIRAAGVLLVTYVPAMSLGLLDLLGRR